MSRMGDGLAPRAMRSVVLELAAWTVATVAILACFDRSACAQWPSQWTDSVSALTPDRYGFRRLLRDLEWANLKVPPLALADAYDRYATQLSTLEAQCKPLVDAAPEDVNYGQVPKPQTAPLASRMMAQHRRMATLGAAAEDQLLTELAAAAGSSDEMIVAFAELKARRKFDRLTQQAMALKGLDSSQLDIPIHVGVAVRCFVRPSELTEDERTKFLALQTQHASSSARDWAVLQQAVEDAVLVRLTNPEEPAPEHVRARIAAVNAAAKAASAVSAKEFALLQATKSALPAAIAARLMTRRSEWFVGGDNLDFLPQLGTDPVNRAPRSVARSVLGEPSISADARKAAGELLQAWIREDDAMLDRALEDERVRFAAEGVQNWEPVQAVRAARLELQRSYAERLFTATKLTWLTDRAASPTPVDSLRPLTLEEQSFVGSVPPWTKDEEREANVFYEDWKSTYILLPVPISDMQRAELSLSLALNEDQRLVADSLFEDARAAWQATVAPDCARLLQAHTLASRHYGGEVNKDFDQARKAAAEYGELMKGRGKIWKTADAIDDRLFDGLTNALGTTSAAGVDRIAAFRASRHIQPVQVAAQTASHGGYDTPANPARVALAISSTPAECAAILRAIASASASVFQWTKEAREEVLRHQEQETKLIEDWLALGPMPKREERTEAFKQAMLSCMESQERQRLEGLALARRMQVRLLALSKEISSGLEPALAQRLTRCELLDPYSQFLSLACMNNLIIERALADLPNGLPHAQKANQEFVRALDHWLERTDPFIQDIAVRRALSYEQKQDDQNLPAINTHRYSGLIFSTLNDQMDLTRFRMAHELPREVVIRVPMLARLVSN